ncbi:hypothetical protein BLOT_015267 [Blomia tropicalis]|nr:hypothetical protein BLOT_015267 [Blomia tropicalis]
MALFYALATYVQHNDEYPLFWMMIYAIPCLITILIAFDSRSTYVDLFHRMIYTALCLYMIFSIYLFIVAMHVIGSNQDKDGNQEYNILDYQEGKELFGVLIIQSWLLITIYFLNAKVPFDVLMTWTSKLIIIILSISPLALWAYHGCYGSPEKRDDHIKINLNSNQTIQP